MKRYAIIAGLLLLGAIAGMSIRSTEAQVQVRTEHELQVVALEAHLWRMSRAIEEQRGALAQAVKLVKDHGDSTLIDKFRAAGFPMGD